MALVAALALLTMADALNRVQGELSDDVRSLVTRCSCAETADMSRSRPHAGATEEVVTRCSCAATADMSRSRPEASATEEAVARDVQVSAGSKVDHTVLLRGAGCTRVSQASSPRSSRSEGIRAANLRPRSRACTCAACCAFRRPRPSRALRLRLRPPWDVERVEEREMVAEFSRPSCVCVCFFEGVGGVLRVLAGQGGDDRHEARGICHCVAVPFEALG